MDNKQILPQTELTAYAQHKKEEAANKPKSEFLNIPYLGNFKADDTPYDPLDFKEVRKRILDNAELAIKTRFPLESDKYILTVDDVHYQKHNYTLKDEKAALRDGNSLSARLKGTWRLYNKVTGKLVEEKTSTLLNVPYMTDKGTFIRNGSEYALKSMFRLRSGVYTRIKNDGNIATHINPEQGTGRQSTINMDPETGVFTVKMGTRNYGLLPLLKAMNSDPALIEKTWGKELFETNYNKYRNIMTGADVKGSAEYDELWRDKYSKMKLDPETTGHTLGVPFKEINSDMFMRATGKILNIAKTYDTSLTDARDSLLFQKVMGPADYIPERIVRDGGGLTRNLFNQINRMGNLSVIQPGTYQPHVDSVFLDDKHAGYVEGASPFEALDLNGMVSRLGEGGIGDLRAAPLESRYVQNSYLGFIDPIRSPESLAVGLNNYLSYGTKKDSNGNLYSMFIRNGETKPKYLKMTEAAKSIVATPEYNYKDADPNEFIPAIVKGRDIEYVRRKDVDYYLASSNRMMSVGASTIPGIGGIRSNRTLMGCLHPETELTVWVKEETKDKVYTYIPKDMCAYELLELQDLSNYYLPVLADKDDVEAGMRLEPIRGVHKTAKDSQVYVVRVDNEECKVNERHKWWVRDVHGTRLLTTAELREGMHVPITEKPVNLVDKPDWGVVEAIYAVWDTIDYFVDIDVNDNVYAVSCGIFTHNSKYPLQALPLQNREAPLVQRALTLDDGTETTTERFIGSALGARFSPIDGKVISVDADEVHIRGIDGQKYTVDLYNEYPANQKGFIHNTVQVKPGQPVKANDLIASSNYTTNDGTAALGVNLKTAFLNAPEGASFEDGIYISESAAKKLTSEQLYKTNISDDDDIEFDKNKFVNLFKAEKFTPEQLDKLDDTGIVKIGTTLEYGDPMVIGVQNKPAGLHGIANRATVPYIETWNHHYPGVVTDVTAGSKKAAVYVKTYTPMKPGDKMCYDDKTEAYTSAGWKLFKDITEDDQFLTLDYRTGQTHWSHYSRYYCWRHKGALYAYESKYVSLRLTSEHNHLVAFSPSSDFMKLEKIKVMKGQDFYHVIGTDLSNPESFARAREEGVPYKECWVRYDGYVYCVEIPDTHTVYVRRNGKSCWSGNSNRLGAKATVAAVVADEDMLKDSNGEPFDVIQSTLGIPSRINPVQLAELQLGKIAKHTGKAEVLPDFPDFNIREYTLNKLKENGLSDTETCYDPLTGMKINDVATGYMFQYKLKHMAESKKGARSTGDYTTEGLPLKGGEEGARRFGSMEWGAVVGHTGVESEVAKDAKLVKGQRNDEFWRDVRNGKTPDKPGIPLVHKKFMAHLQAAGVNLEDKGKTLHAFGATDEDIRRLTKNRQVTVGSTYDSKDLRPIKGGLFDPNIFGDDGDQWGYFELPEPVLNPLMADSIKDILGWKNAEMQEVLEGARSINGKTGTEAVMAVLDNMDLDKELRDTKALLKHKDTPVSKRSDLIKKYRALYSIDKQDKHPNDFFLTRIPILPPKFRPVSVIGNDVGIVADANFLYKKMIDAVSDFNEAKAVLPEEELLDARKTLYNSIEAVVGMKDPEDKKLQSKKVEGVLRWAFGKGSPKLGSLQFKVLGATVDVGGRNVITPDNSLGLDEVGISEETAWKMYEPFVVRKLRQKGFNMTKAVDMVINRDKEALPVLEECLKERPLLINRAPTLHKFSIMAMRPKITKGNTLRIPPPICKGFNADFDGNCVDFNTEIFLKSALDNSYFYAILMLVSEKHDIDINNLKKKGLFMLTKENMIVIGDAKTNEATYIGPIGKLPRQGTPVKDRNGADVYELPEGVSVLSYDVKTGYPCWKAVKHLTVEQNTPVVKVVAGVHELIVSDNESLAVFDNETGLLKKVAPKDAKGMLIPSLRQDPMCCGTYGNTDLGWLHGMFISDGWTDICHNVTGIAKMEDCKRDRFVAICREQLDANLTLKKYEYTNVKTSVKKLGDSCKYHIQSELVSAHFTDINCYDYTSNVDVVTEFEKSALHKTIPFDCLHKGSEEYLWGLLSGLLDGDGSITCNTVYSNPRYGAHVSTSSPFLRDGLKTLGHKLGIRVSVTTTKPRGLSNEAYTVTFSTVDLKKNLDKLCCVGTHETSVLAAWRTAVENMDRNDFVPITDKEMTVVCKALRTIGENTTYTAMRKGYACRSTLLASLEKLDDCYRQSDEFKSLYARTTDPNTLWVQVKDVEDLDSREVFDLEVEDTKIFVVNQGLVVWDTMNYHVPVSQQAVKEAYEKMLPSRNLLSPSNMRAHYKPVGEFAQGLFLGSRINNKKKPIRFNSLADAQQALKEGLIKWDDPIDIPDAEADRLLNKGKD